MEEPKKTPKIFNPFRLLEDIQLLPNENFVRDKVQYSDLITYYSYDKPVNFLGMFTMLSYSVFPTARTRSFKISSNLQVQKELNQFLEYINNVAKSLGKDDENLGEFNMSEIEELKAFSWKGRKWTKQKPEIRISQAMAMISITFDL